MSEIWEETKGSFLCSTIIPDVEKRTAVSRGYDGILRSRKEVRPFLEWRLRVKSRLPQVRGQVPVSLLQSIEKCLCSQTQKQQPFYFDLLQLTIFHIN